MSDWLVICDWFDRTHGILNECCYEAVTDRDRADREIGDGGRSGSG
jgi:hypothetical protein